LRAQKGGLPLQKPDSLGDMAAKNLENGTSSLFPCDTANRLTGIEHSNALNLPVSLAYTLDKIGNRKSNFPAMCQSYPRDRHLSHWHL